MQAEALQSNVSTAGNKCGLWFLPNGRTVAPSWDILAGIADFVKAFRAAKNFDERNSISESLYLSVRKSPAL
jgi:hypothetical protein